MKQLQCITISLLLFLLPLSAHGTEIIIQAAGDVMLGGRWEQQVARNGYFHAFERIAPELKKADITLVNLEAPLTRRGEEFTDKKYRFRVHPAAAAALKKAGITTVTLANNHSMDFGKEGLLDTLQQLKKAGIGHVGAGENLAAARKPIFYDIRGIRVAMLGYSLTLPSEFWASNKRAGTAPLLERLVKQDIAAARTQAAIVLVAVHWGEEGTTRLREYQPRLARLMIDSGADAVIGHHPHILQGIEHYKRGVIFYSLGNFAFASKSRIADRTLLVRLHFDGDKRTAELVPVNILHREVGFQPTSLTGHKAAELIQRIRQLPPGTVTMRHEGARWLVDF
jgi:poly-gamma-glutamate synthesis protein (capsule biosynthesis protein)